MNPILKKALFEAARAAVSALLAALGLSVTGCAVLPVFNF